MKTPLLLTAGAAALFGTALFLSDREPGTPPTPVSQAPPARSGEQTPPPDATPLPVVADASQGPVASTTGARTPVPPPPTSAPPPVPTNASPAERLLTGRVVDADGRPVSGLEVWCRAAHPEPARLVGTSDGAGAFALDPEADAGDLEVRDAAFGTVLGCRVEPRLRHAPTLVVAPRVELGGSVRDEEGTPVPRAEVRTTLSRRFTTSIDGVLDNSVRHEPSVHTDEEGRFRFAEALAVPGTTLHVTAQGHEPLELELPLTPAPSLELVLRRRGARADDVLGQVVDAGGRGAPDAWVSLGFRSVRTDATGGFRIDSGSEGGHDRILAVKSGAQPGLVARPRDATGEPCPWPSFVLVPLGPAPLALAGRAVDLDGNPLASWRVWATDPTFFGPIGDVPTVVEGLAQGLPAESAVSPAANATWPFTVTDAEGRFELGGLVEREYELALMLPGTVRFSAQGPFAAGRRDLLLTVDPEAGVGPIAGRVVDGEGRGLEGVEMHATFPSYSLPRDASTELSWVEGSRTVRTDADGAFRIERVRRGEGVLHADHPDLLPAYRSLLGDPDGSPREGDDWEALTVVCQRRVHLKVTVGEPLPTDGRLKVLDADGGELMIRVFSNGRRRLTRAYRLLGGRTEVLSVPEAAHTLVVIDAEGEECHRQELHLAFGELNLLALP